MIHAENHWGTLWTAVFVASMQPYEYSVTLPWRHIKWRTWSGHNHSNIGNVVMTMVMATWYNGDSNGNVLVVLHDIVKMETMMVSR